jgi:hypothetical protein
MSTGTLWALCSSSASSLSWLPKPEPPPQGDPPQLPQFTRRPDHTSGLPSNLRVPYLPPSFLYFTISVRESVRFAPLAASVPVTVIV